jgi:hypothetical protein
VTAMAESRTPLEQALDLMLFAPIGLALTVVEDFPQLAEKGRARVEQRVATARVVGQFAVAEGRRRLQGSLGSQPQATVRTAGADRQARRDAAEAAAPSYSAPAPVDAPASAELAIPGYDSLSASQVVQRLPSLSPAELAAVGAYEASTRGRRTILARIAQLQQS